MPYFSRTIRFAVRGLALLSLLPALACAQDPNAAVRGEFSAALTRAEAGETSSVDSATLRSYVLYPYVLAARLLRELQGVSGSATDDRVRSFLANYPTLPVARDLHRAWLQRLAQRQEWVTFASAYVGDVADDDLRCQFLLAHIKTAATVGLQDDLLKIWLSGQQMPQTCTPAFDWAKTQGWLTPALFERRARTALAAGNADLGEFLAQSLPAETAAPLQRWARLIRAPQDELAVLIAAPSEPVESDALIDGYTRLARSKPEDAQKIYNPLLKARKLKGADVVPYTAALALGLAWSRLPQSLDYFRKLPDATADDKVQEWRVRAALWNGNWTLARDWLQALSKPLAAQDRWTYWRARSLAHFKRSHVAATAIYQELMAKNNLFGVLAAAQLGKPHRPTPQPQLADATVQATLSNNVAVIRAHELHLAARDVWAVAEWRRALEDATSATRLQAGLLASSWGWHAQAIPTLAWAAAYDDFDRTYPLSYEPAVRKAHLQSDLPEPVIYGVMRQESLYDASAVSRRDALGLMQLLLPTARAVACRAQLPAPSRNDLFDPETNLTLGADYLRELITRNNGSLVLALGAYNAGPNAVTRWLPDTPKDADIWIENIPYTETRSYIQKILWHIAVFGWKETGEPQDLSALLKPVTKAP